MRLLTILLLLSSALLCSGAEIDDIREAAEQGDASAQHRPGLMYGNGSGVVENYVEAVKLLRKRADQGNADAQSKWEELFTSP